LKKNNDLSSVWSIHQAYKIIWQPRKFFSQIYSSFCSLSLPLLYLSLSHSCHGFWTWRSTLAVTLRHHNYLNIFVWNIGEKNTTFKKYFEVNGIEILRCLATILPLERIIFLLYCLDFLQVPPSPFLSCIVWGKPAENKERGVLAGPTPSCSNVAKNGDSTVVVDFLKWNKNIRIALSP